MNDEKKKYITFALPMIRSIFVNPQNAINEIFMYGCYRASLNMEANRFNAYRQLLHCAMSKELQYYVPTNLMQLVIDSLDGADPEDMRDDYMAKNGSGTIDENLVDDFIVTHGEKRDGEVMEWYKFMQAADVLGILGNKRNFLETGRKYNKIYGRGEVPVSVSVDFLFRLRDSIRTEYDRVRCAMYLAIRSLCANGVAVTTSQAIQWRMMGCRNKQELDKVLKDKKIKSVWEKYATRRQYRTLLNDLINSKLIIEMQYSNRTCVSASIIEESAFVEAVAAKIRKINAKQRNTTAAAQRQRLSGLLKERINSS